MPQSPQRILIPQELLSEISSFGQVHHDLSPEYISQYIQSLAHESNINANLLWQSELTLQKLILRDTTYQVHGNLLKLIPRSYKIDVLLWDHKLNVLWNRYTHSRNRQDVLDEPPIYQAEYPSISLRGTCDRFYDSFHEDLSIHRALEISSSYSHFIDRIKSLGYEVIVDSQYIVIPIGDNITCNDIHAARYLIYPRTILDSDNNPSMCPG